MLVQYLKSLGAVVIPVEIRRRIFTQSFCFVYLFVCLFFEGQGGYAICELSSEGVLEVSKSNLKLWQFVKVYLQIHRLLSSIKRASGAYYDGFEKKRIPRRNYGDLGGCYRWSQNTPTLLPLICISIQITLSLILIIVKYILPFVTTFFCKYILKINMIFYFQYRRKLSFDSRRKPPITYDNLR